MAKIYCIRSFDHRMLDESDEAARCELYTSSRSVALGWARELVRLRLADDQDREPDLYDPAPPSREPVEMKLTEIKLAQLSPLQLALACLNGRGWAEHMGPTETLYFDHRGRDVTAIQSSPPAGASGVLTP